METNYLSIDDLRHRREVTSDSVLNCIVSVYPGAISEPFRRPDGRQPWFNLADILLKPPAPEIADLQSAIRGESDPEKRSALKRNMIAFTPSGFFEPDRKAGNLQHHTALIPFDIDFQDNGERLENYQDLKTEISKIPFVAYAGLSLSGRGLWGLIAVSRDTARERHKDHFRALQEDFAAMGIVIDPAPASPASLRFYAYDPDGYINHYPDLYTRLYMAPEVPKARPQAYTTTKTRMTETSSPVWKQFNETADICAMLEHYGWKPAGKDGEGIRYIRPGKQSGKSAWALPSKNIVYIWTSSTSLEPNKCYNPFALYAYMEHGGDWKAAAKTIGQTGK